MSNPTKNMNIVFSIYSYPGIVPPPPPPKKKKTKKTKQKCSEYSDTFQPFDSMSFLAVFQTRHSNRRKRRFEGSAQLHAESQRRGLEILPRHDGSNQEDILTRPQTIQTELGTKLASRRWVLHIVAKTY